MPGIEFLDYARGDHITADVRDEIINIVHDILEQIAGKRPGHSNFRYTPAGYLDTSGFDYILVVDGEESEKTNEFKQHIRVAIKKNVAKLLRVKEERIAVRYRLYNSSFG